MPKTAVVTARIEPDLKENVESILSRLGLTTSQAVSLYFRQIESQRGIPFSLKLQPEQQSGAESLRALSGMFSSGHKDTSENVEALVAEAILQKYGDNTP